MAVLQVTHSPSGAQGRYLCAHAATKPVLGSWPLVFGQIKTRNQSINTSAFLRVLCGKTSPVFALSIQPLNHPALICVHLRKSAAKVFSVFLSVLCGKGFPVFSAAQAVSL
jgi:hypothetical protein